MAAVLGRMAIACRRGIGRRRGGTPRNRTGPATRSAGGTPDGLSPLWPSEPRRVRRESISLDERHGVDDDALAPAGAVHALVGLALDADRLGRHVEHGRERGPHGVRVRPDLRALAHDDDVHVADTVARAVHALDRGAQHHEAVGALPPRVRVGKQLADVAEVRGAEHGVRDRVSHRVRVGMPGQPAVVGNAHAAEDEFASLRETMRVVAEADPRRRCHSCLPRCTGTRCGHVERRGGPIAWTRRSPPRPEGPRAWSP